MLKNDILINIIADDREQKSEVIKLLAGIENVTLEIRRLSIGVIRLISGLLLKEKP